MIKIFKKVIDLKIPRTGFVHTVEYKTGAKGIYQIVTIEWHNKEYSSFPGSRFKDCGKWLELTPAP